MMFDLITYFTFQFERLKHNLVYATTLPQEWSSHDKTLDEMFMIQPKCKHFCLFVWQWQQPDWLASMPSWRHEHLFASIYNRMIQNRVVVSGSIVSPTIQIHILVVLFAYRFVGTLLKIEFILFALWFSGQVECVGGRGAFSRIAFKNNTQNLNWKFAHYSA